MRRQEAGNPVIIGRTIGFIPKTVRFGFLVKGFIPTVCGLERLLQSLCLLKRHPAILLTMGYQYRRLETAYAVYR